MQIVIDISEELYESYKDRPPMLGDAGMDMIAQSIANGTPLDGVLQEIRAEIEKPLHDERFFDTANAKAQAIALNWVCELIDKHIKEIEE